MRVLVATSIYEAARPYLDAWIDGVTAAVRSFASPVDILVANDGFRNVGHILRRLEGYAAVVVCDVESTSPAMTRQKMIEAAARSDADVVIFSDCDDIPCPGAIPAHLETLRKADFSYGAMIVLGGEADGEPYFDPELVPDRAGRGSLDRGNFTGFTNTAVSRRMLSQLTPRASVALADWDFFRQAVEQGYEGGRTREAVALYRITEGGIASLRPQSLDGHLNVQADLAHDFLRQQPDAAAFMPITGFIARRGYAGLGMAAKPILMRRTPWFQFVFDLHDTCRRAS